LNTWLPLPPNRTGGFPASGSPVGGLTSKRTVKPVRRLRIGEQPTTGPNGVTPPDTPRPGVPQQTCGSPERFHSGPAGPSVSGPFSPVGHSRPVVAPPRWVTRLHLPTPLRSAGITPLPRYYGCSDSWAALLTAQVSLLHVVGLPTVPSPTTLRVPSELLHATPQFDGSPTPCQRQAVASLMASRLATLSGRIEFVILRTGRSPPAALHLASRRRSSSRFQAGARMPGGDLHPSDHHACRRTSRRRKPPDRGRKRTQPRRGERTDRFCRPVGAGPFEPSFRRLTPPAKPYRSFGAGPAGEKCGLTTCLGRRGRSRAGASRGRRAGGGPGSGAAWSGGRGAGL